MLKGNLKSFSVSQPCDLQGALCCLLSVVWTATIKLVGFCVPQKSELTLALANMLGCNVRAQVINNTRKKNKKLPKQSTLIQGSFCLLISLNYSCDLRGAPEKALKARHEGSKLHYVTEKENTALEDHTPRSHIAIV